MNDQTFIHCFLLFVCQVTTVALQMHIMHLKAAKLPVTGVSLCVQHSQGY